MGSGRTKGAVSNVTVKLDDLQSILKSDANVVINRRFADTLGLSYVVPDRKELNKMLKTKKDEAQKKIDMKVVGK